MFTISKAQMTKLGEPALERFIVDTIIFMRAECTECTAGRNDGQLRHVVLQFIDIGKHYDVVTERNVQRLLFYTLQNKLSVPYSDPLEAALRIEGWDETYRIKQFIKLLPDHGDQGI